MMAGAVSFDNSPMRQPFAFGGRHQVANDGCIIVRDEDAADYPEKMYVPDDQLQPLALDDYQNHDSVDSSSHGASSEGSKTRASSRSSPSCGPVRSKDKSVPHKRWNGQRWNDTETKKLIELFGLYPNLIGKKLWEQIGLGLRNSGYQRTDSQAREKWRDVYSYYKKHLESFEKTREFPDVPFFEQLHEIYSKRATPTSTGNWGRTPAVSASTAELSKLVKETIKKETTPQVSRRSSQPQNATPQQLQQTDEIHQQSPIASSTSVLASSTSQSLQSPNSNRQMELLEKLIKMQEQQIRMQSQLLQLERKRVANETKQTEYLGRLVAMLGDVDEEEMAEDDEETDPL